jgi:hypothetical protein
MIELYTNPEICLLNRSADILKSNVKSIVLRGVLRIFGLVHGKKAKGATLLPVARLSGCSMPAA